MKTLSVRQPFAWLLIRPDLLDPRERAEAQRRHFIKDIENRPWSAGPQGIIAIHASRTFSREGYELVQENFPKITLPAPEEFDFGGVIGTVGHCGSVDAHRSPWFTGPYGHMLEDPRPCVFRECRGALGFFKFPDRLIVYL
jgi:hypothetical protein